MDPLPSDQAPFQASPPQITHPAPPQIFDSFSQNGAMLDSETLGPMFSDDGGYLVDDNGDHNDPKRRRIARACDMCRKKKIKCDGRMPKCSHCDNYKTDCVFTHIEKKRNPPKGAKYIEGLENRLGRMEHLLRLSGLLTKADEGQTDLGTLEQRLAQQTASSNTSPTQESDHSGPVSPNDRSNPLSEPTRTTTIILTPQSGSMSPHGGSERSAEKPKTKSASKSGSKSGSKSKQDEVEALSDMMCSLVTNSCGETRYIGSSSSFSIFSPKGIQWVSEKTGDDSFQHMIASIATDDNKWIHWRPEVFGDIFARRVFKPLPPKEEAISLLKDYFESFNNIFPLFHEPTFMHLVDLQYSQEPYEGSGWWASLNVALAIAYRIRIMNNLVPGDFESDGWGYFKNALAVQTELTMRNNDLLSVQALLGMAVYLLGTPNPQPSFFLIAAAVRLAHSVGLHKRGSGFNLNKVEDEQRKRVFWIGYMLDKDICLRAGRPPVQDDDDMNVELPSEDPDDNVGNILLADGKGEVNLFLLMVKFAIIASKVYKQLYSVKGSKQSDGELLNTIGELDAELEAWKDSIPLDFRPEHEINAAHTPLILQVVVLHFAYYNCLTTIHRMSVHHGYWTSRLSNYAIQGLNVRPLNPRVFSSAALCVSAARASINLIKYIPHGDYACVWLIIYYPVSALVTLFANILQNPQDARGRSDLKLINVVVNFLPMISEDKGGSQRHMVRVCSEFERIARLVLDKAERESSSRRKRKSDTSKVGSSHSRKTSTVDPASSQTSPRLDNPNFGKLNGIPQSSDPMFNNMYPVFSNGNAPFPANFADTQQLPHSFNGPNSSNHQSPNSPAFADNYPTSISAEYGSDFSHQHDHTSPNFNGYGSQNGIAFEPSPFNNSSMPFQQPFVPQDLWSMPMTFEWDWADATNNGNEDLGRNS